MSPRIPYELAKNKISNNFDNLAAQLLNEKYSARLENNQSISLEAFDGNGLVLLRAHLGSAQKAHEFELFMEAKDQNTDESIHLLLDFLDGVLEEFFMNGQEGGLPLDFCERQFEEIKIFARQEFRDFAAERMADNFLKSHLDK